MDASVLMSSAEASASDPFAASVTSCEGSVRGATISFRRDSIWASNRES